MSVLSILRIIKVGMSRDWARVREYEEQQDERNLDHDVGDIFSQYCDAGVSRCDESVPEPLGGQTYAPGGYSGQGDNEILRGMAGSAPGGLPLVETRCHRCLRRRPDLPAPPPGAVARLAECVVYVCCLASLGLNTWHAVKAAEAVTLSNATGRSCKR